MQSPVLSLAFGLSATLLGLAGEARAQEASYNAHNLHLAAFDGDLRDPLLVQRAGRLRQFDWFAGGVLEYANAPLVRYDIRTDGSQVRTEVLDHVVALNLSAGVSLHERLRIDLAAPLFFASYDAEGNYQGVDFGDLRFTAMVPILMPSEEDTGFGLGVSLNLDMPTGARKEFLGNGGVAGGGNVLASYALDGLTLSGTVGLQFRPDFDLGNIRGTDSFRAGIGVGYKVHETTSINLETQIAASFKRNREPGTESPIELLLSLRHRQPVGAHFVAGAAAGVTDGIGAPRFRVFLGGGFGKIGDPPVKDADGDGLLDDVDACINEPETVNGYLDTDGCPDGLANLDVRVLYEGQPVEGAEIALGLAESDSVERMTSTVEPRRKTDLMPGEVWEASATSGTCLAGVGEATLAEGENRIDVRLAPQRGGKVVYELIGPKGEVIKDAVSTWKASSPGCVESTGYQLGPDGRYEHPIGSGTHTVFIDAPGFRIHREDVTINAGDVYVIRAEMKPTKVSVDQKEIKILESVFFETNSDKILPQSFELLNEVADTIVSNNVGRVQVEGHTDDRGSDASNLDLSQRRAESVRAYLIGRGVAADMLIPKGFGETQPIATNATAAGRAQNRRVVFTLLDQASQVIEVPASP